jgi:nephrocystin-4
VSSGFTCFRLVTDTREWQHYKLTFNTATPLEEDMFSDTDTTDSSSPQLFLKPNETVYIPFKYQSFHLQTQPCNKTAPFGSHSLPSRPHLVLQSKTIKVSFVKTDDSRPVSILSLHVEPQPHCIDQTFHFRHPEQAFFKKAIILPSFQSVTGKTGHSKGL